MKAINQALHCALTCSDVLGKPLLPLPALDPEKIRLILVSEAPPERLADHYYQEAEGAFFRDTQAAFRDAGMEIERYADLTRAGIYLTTAIKCRKQAYGVSGQTIRSCSQLLEEELAQFPGVRVIMCMGDFAIKAINHVTKRKYRQNAVPAGPTYRIRGEAHVLNGIRYFPSYTHTGESCRIETSKRRMIAEDIRNALAILR